MSDIMEEHEPDETGESCDDILPHSPLELVLSCVRDFRLPEPFYSPDPEYSAEKGLR